MYFDLICPWFCRTICLMIAVCLPCLPAPILHAQPAEGLFEIVDLGTLGGAFSRAAVVNDAGEVAGESQTRDREVHSFFWNGRPLVDLGTLGSGHASIAAINDAGQVVGTSGTGRILEIFPGFFVAEVQAYLWTEPTGMVGLGTLGGFESRAADINSSGYVVGRSYLADEESEKPFLWTPKEGMIDLGSLGGTFGWATAINDRGQIAGNSFTAGGELHAFLWSAETGMIDLGLATEVVGINDLGQVAGNYRPSPFESEIPFIAWLDSENGVQREDLPLGSSSGRAIAMNNRGDVVGRGGESGAVLWTADGQTLDLGTLGGEWAIPEDVNDAGQVVGRSETDAGREHAFFWSEELGMIDLDSLPSDFPGSRAAKLNNSGVVIGSSNVLKGTNRESHAVVWMPVGLGSPLQQRMEELFALLGEMILAGDIDQGPAHALEAKLRAVNDALGRGHEDTAARLLESMLIQLAALAAAERIDAAAADTLAEGLEALLALL